MKNQIICGDALEALKTLPSESVNCCVTSPPYFGLRDYGVDGQIGYVRRFGDNRTCCKEHKRNFIMIDINEKYCDLQRERLDYETRM